MNPNCPRCGAKASVRHGRFRRQDDSQWVPRYRCKACGKTHSSATHSPAYRQKRRRLNPQVMVEIASGTSQRRIAIKLRCDPKTVARKITWLGEQLRTQSACWLAAETPWEHVQWDELISFEHSRLKPLAVAVMVGVRDRAILGIGVAEIPASGPIAQKSRERYGPRPDQSPAMRCALLERLAPLLDPDKLTIDSDQHKDYPGEIARTLPHADHRCFRSIRGSLTGLGELKRTANDPLFRINHTLAMLRDNIKRFARKTWCTTKRRDVLEDILVIYQHWHNTVLTAKCRASTA